MNYENNFIIDKDDGQILFSNENDIELYINKLKINISKIDNNMILYDIRSKNIYLITDENVYSRINIQDYRFPDEELLQLLIKTLYELNKKNKLKLSDDEIVYIEKLNKNINILSCFDLKILKKTYYKIFYISSNIGKELTTCLKPFYIPYINNKINISSKIDYKINPYYTTSELINNALNMGLTKVGNINLKQVYGLCK
jgi:hypothetical protein